MKSNNEKRDYRKLLIPALIIGAPALLAYGCYFYNKNIVEAPAMTSMVSLFISNYTLLMIGLAIVLCFNGFDVAEKKTCVFYKGVIFIAVSFLVIVRLIVAACKIELGGQECELLMHLLDNGYCQNLLIPTVLSAASAYGVALISDSAYNKREQTRRNKKKRI